MCRWCTVHGFVGRWQAYLWGNPLTIREFSNWTHSNCKLSFTGSVGWLLIFPWNHRKNRLLLLCSSICSKLCCPSPLRLHLRVHPSYPAKKLYCILGERTFVRNSHVDKLELDCVPLSTHCSKSRNDIMPQRVSSSSAQGSFAKIFHGFATEKPLTAWQRRWNTFSGNNERASRSEECGAGRFCWNFSLGFNLWGPYLFWAYGLWTPPPHNNTHTHTQTHRCSISSHIFKENAVVTECGHSFSEQTLTEWMASRDECPICQAKLSKKSVFPNYKLREIISKVGHFSFNISGTCWDVTLFCVHCTFAARLERLMYTLVSKVQKRRNYIRIS